MTKASRTEHRLEGLEPDNLLAFMALLGLLRALETARPEWRPRVRWSIEVAPLRPVLHVREAVDSASIFAAAAKGVRELAVAHALDGRKDLDHTIREGREFLLNSRSKGEHAADLATALLSDAAVKIEQRKPLDQIEATPLCLLFGQGHQHFLQRLADVPNLPAPPPRGRGRTKETVSAEQAIEEAVFSIWSRQDPTFSFRWDPAEDVRYAMMWGDPSYSGNKDGTQHGANRLAAIGLAAMTVAPQERQGEVRLSMLGGVRSSEGFVVRWPIWRDPLSLAAIRSLLCREDLGESEVSEWLSIERVMEARRISVGKFMNFTVARGA